MESSAFQALDASLYRRGHLITAVARWLSIGLALLILPFVWDEPNIRPRAALAVALTYLLFNFASQLWLQKLPQRRLFRVVHDLVDALAVGLGAAVSGGLQSPIWLLLYPHVVSVAVRGGLGYSMAIGALDAVIVSVLAHLADQPLGNLHSLTLLFCAFMGGTTSAHLQSIQRRLAAANAELGGANRQLSETLAAQVESQKQQELTLLRLAALNEIADAVNLSLTIEHIFAVAAAETRRLVPCDRVAIALVAEGGLEVVAVGEGGGRRKTDLGPGDVTWAFVEPRLWSRGAGQPPPHCGALLDEPAVAALATLPLRSNDRVTGSLILGRRQPDAFNAEDLHVIEPVARHIAIALANARLLEDVSRRSDELETLLEIGRNIVERLDLGELLPLVARSVNRVMGTSHCLLLLRSGDDLMVAAQEGLEPEVVEAFQGIKVGHSLSGWVIKEGKVLAVPDMREDPRLRYADMVVRYDYRSYLGVPLRHGSETLGSLEVVTKGRPRRFAPEEQALMTAFAHQVAVAIANARLFEQARAHLEQVVEANRRLEELDRLRREYLRNVSHEFRTPLTVIKGYAEFLLESPGESGAPHEVMQVIVESCDRVIDLVETLIEVSRIEQGEAERILNVRRLDLREVAETSVEALRWFAARKKIRVELDFPVGDLGLEADGSLLQQVVKKLLDNALKYSPPGARVLLRATPGQDEMQLDVEDAGIGIAAEHLPRIFEKFYMVDGSIARRVGGTGVGLYLVREIVRLHHGSVQVKSLPGEGSVFSVRLPRQFQRRPRAALA